LGADEVKARKFDPLPGTGYAYSSAEGRSAAQIPNKRNVRNDAMTVTSGVRMTDVLTDSPPTTRAFVIRGEILAWDPLNRELQIGTHLVCVAPSVPTAKLKCGVTGTVSGQEICLSGRWIVTQLTVDC
jgi:hypothetical protein